MFNAMGHRAAPSDTRPIAFGGEPVSFFAALSSIGGDEGIDLRSLPPGTRVIVDTRNSRYCLVVREGQGSNAVLQGGRYCRDETAVFIDGSTLGGGLRIGWIGVGLCLELSVRGKRVLTSRVRSITVEPLCALPVAR
jgi:hypothetical protein